MKSTRQVEKMKHTLRMAVLLPAFVMMWVWGSYHPLLASGQNVVSHAEVAPVGPAFGLESRRVLEGSLLKIQAQAQANQMFQGDLRVERGQVIEGDMVVYDGDVRIDAEGRIDGNLVVFSGDITIAGNGVVEGNVDLFSGDANIAGIIDGNLALWDGDVELANTARIGGNVSVLSGEIDRAQGAEVGGSLVEGPSLGLNTPDIPGLFGRGAQPDDAALISARPRTFIQWTIAFLARLMGAVLLTGFIAVLVGLIVHVRPHPVDVVRTRLIEKPAISFVIGLAVNLILMFLGGLLAVTVCLLPIALVPMLGLLAVNLLGWAALAQLVGNRVESYTDRTMEGWVSAAIGAVLLTGIFALLWAFGGFFRVMGSSILLFVGSFGAGAVLLPWIMRVMKPAPRRDATPDAGAETVTPGDVSYRGTGLDDRVMPPVVTPAADIAHGAPPADARESAMEQLDAREQAARAEAPQDLSAADLQVDPETADTGAEDFAHEDDFTQLKGIGQVLDGRLKDAGVRTFGQLAALSPAAVAEIVGWSEDRVVRSELLEQARAAAE